MAPLEEYSDSDKFNIHRSLPLTNHKNTFTTREFEKTFRGSCKLPKAHEKVCENESKNKQREKDAHVKILLMEGGIL